MDNEILKQIPWVKHLKTPQPCDGIKWRIVPLKAIYNHGPGKSLPPIGLDNYRCKNPAKWKFKSLPKSNGKDGTYCYIHLYRELHDDTTEYNRLVRWYNRWLKQQGISHA